MKPISHHIFIFPFKWDLSSGKPVDLPYAERCDLAALHDRLKNEPPTRISRKEAGDETAEAWQKLSWERYAFNWSANFNEAVYFLPHVRAALFDSGKGEPGIGLQYHISGNGRNWNYRIDCTDGHSFILPIEQITLNFYNTGIGFLAFHLNNFTNHDPDNILRINDFGRHIYPQFLGKPDANNRLAKVKDAFMADTITILVGEQPITGSDFQSTLGFKGKNYDSEGWLIPDFIMDWLPPTLRADRKVRRGDARIRPLLDDRMFLICWVGHKTWSAAVKTDDKRKPYETNEQWHRLIFVDGISPGMANNQLLQQLNCAHTNDRWGGEGTFYGASRYSFVALMDDSDFSADVLLPYMQTMYFQVALLCLLQRGSIVRFSEEITRLNNETGRKGQRDAEAQGLYQKYLQFINQIYFREVTPQEQGIELYRLLQDKMEIDREVKSLQSEIQDYFNLLKLQTDERQTEALNLLTMVGSGLLPPALILAYFGISAFPELKDGWKLNFTCIAAWLAAGSGLSGFMTAWIWVRWNRYRWAAAIGLVVTIGIFIWAACLPFLSKFMEHPQ